MKNNYSEKFRQILVKHSEYFHICHKMACSIFYPYSGMAEKFPGGVPETFSNGAGTQIIFPRGSGQVFQKGHTNKGKPSSGVTCRKLVSYGPLSALPPCNSRPKMNLENCLPDLCMVKKNGIA